MESTYQTCPNPRCELPIRVWDLKCIVCGWNECIRCGVWGPHEQPQQLCQSCIAAEEKANVSAKLDST